MSGTIWTKFYWSDWESDPALRLCSYAAQGLWMRMLCIAAAHDPIGYVAVAGRGLNETALARVTGGTESEVRDLLGELDRNGVFSRDRTGRIYSRRMVADAKRAAIARKNGKNGGNPILRKDGGNPASDNPPDNPRLKPQKPEARSQRTEEASLPVAKQAVLKAEPWAADTCFLAAWDAATPLMRKRSKSREKAWSEWRVARTREAPERILAALRAYVRGDPDVPRTGGPGLHLWLRDRGWDTWLSEDRPLIPGPVDPAVEAHRLAHWRRTGEWKREWGERPKDAA